MTGGAFKNGGCQLVPFFSLTTSIVKAEPFLLSQQEGNLMQEDKVVNDVLQATITHQRMAMRQ